MHAPEFENESSFNGLCCNVMAVYCLVVQCLCISFLRSIMWTGLFPHEEGPSACFFKISSFLIIEKFKISTQ